MTVCIFVRCIFMRKMRNPASPASRAGGAGFQLVAWLDTNAVVCHEGHPLDGRDEGEPCSTDHGYRRDGASAGQAEHPEDTRVALSDALHAMCQPESQRQVHPHADEVHHCLCLDRRGDEQEAEGRQDGRGQRETPGKLQNHFTPYVEPLEILPIRQSLEPRGRGQLVQRNVLIYRIEHKD